MSSFNFGQELSRLEMKEVTAGRIQEPPGGDCSGCSDCMQNDGCGTSGSIYCGMIRDTRDGSYTKCYRN